MENTKVKEIFKKITDIITKYGKIILILTIITINLIARTIVKLTNRAFNKINK